MPKEFNIRSFDFQSRTDMKVRQTSGYADNAMEDPTSTNESVDSGNSDIDRLHDILSPHMPDEAIANGATLSPAGFQKVAAKLGVSAQDVESLLKSLRDQIVKGNGDVVMGESGSSARYSWEHDGLGSVTVRDSKTGEEYFNGGSQGFAILSAVENLTAGSQEEQAFLASYCEDNLSESINEGEDQDEDDADFLGEISADVSTFNFPWKADGVFGTGTAEFKGDAENFNVRVVDVRDQNGEPIVADKAMKDSLKDQAIDFIPKA